MTSAQARLLSLALLNGAQLAEADAERLKDEGNSGAALPEYQNSILLYRLSAVANDFAKALEPDGRDPTPDGPHLTDEEGWRDQQRERRAE